MTRLETAFRDRPNLKPYARMITDHLANRRSNKSVIKIERYIVAFMRWTEKADSNGETNLLRLPIEPETILSYARYLLNRKLKTPTIYQYMSAINSVNSATGHPPLFNHPTVKQFLLQMKLNSDNQKSQKKFALSEDQLDRILRSMSFTRNNDIRINRALLLTMMQAGLKRRETSELAWGNVNIPRYRPGQVRIYSKKIKNSGHILPITRGCVLSLRRIRPPDAGAETRVFGIENSQINRRLRSMSAAADIDPINITSGVPRATLESLMTSRGAPDPQIIQQLRLQPPYPLSPSFTLTRSNRETLKWLMPSIET